MLMHMQNYNIRVNNNNVSHKLKHAKWKHGHKKHAQCISELHCYYFRVTCRAITPLNMMRHV